MNCFTFLICCAAAVLSACAGDERLGEKKLSPVRLASRAAKAAATGKPPSGGALTAVDFEDGTTGDWKIVSANANSKVVAGGASAASKRALRLVAGSNYNDAAFLVNTKIFPVTPNRFYVRFYVKLATALTDGHTSLAVAAGAGRNTEVRLGGQFKILVANVESTDGNRISADNFNGFPRGIAPKAGSWYCMEVLYDGESNVMRTWYDGTEVKNLAITKPSDFNSPPAAKWMPSPFTQLKLGWQSYGAGSANTVYLDDVVVSRTRVGCRKTKTA